MNARQIIITVTSLTLFAGMLAVNGFNAWKKSARTSRGRAARCGTMSHPGVA
jgi:hypothetical protein